MKSLPKRPTIREVAAHAGVSPATVSLVLNGKKAGLPEETCGRVRAAARALGYSPDFSARAMVTGKTQVVGVTFPISPTPFSRRLCGIYRRSFRLTATASCCATAGNARKTTSPVSDCWRGGRSIA